MRPIEIKTINDEISSATVQAEEALLGAILIESTHGDRQAIQAVLAIVSPSDFYGYYEKQALVRQTRHARIFYAMTKTERPPHQITTAQEMNRLGILQSGDCAYLCHLVSMCPCSLDYVDYAKAVREYSLQRQGVVSTNKPAYQGGI